MQLCLQDVFMTSWKTKKCYTEDVFKTSPRRLQYVFTKTNVCWASCWHLISVFSVLSYPFVYIDSIYAENKSNKTIWKYICNISSKPKRTPCSTTKMFFFPYKAFHYCQKIQYIVFCGPNTRFINFFTVFCYFSHSVSSVFYSYPPLWKFFNDNHTVISKNIVP